MDDNHNIKVPVTSFSHGKMDRLWGWCLWVVGIALVSALVFSGYIYINYGMQEKLGDFVLEEGENTLKLPVEYSYHYILADITVPGSIDNHDAFYDTLKKISVVQGVTINDVLTTCAARLTGGVIYDKVHDSSSFNYLFYSIQSERERGAVRRDAWVTFHDDGLLTRPLKLAMRTEFGKLKYYVEVNR